MILSVNHGAADWSSCTIDVLCE